MGYTNSNYIDLVFMIGVGCIVTADGPYYHSTLIGDKWVFESVEIRKQKLEGVYVIGIVKNIPVNLSIKCTGDFYI